MTWTPRYEYGLLRRQGLTGEGAADRIHAVPIAAKVRLLADHGIDFDALPGWHKRGSGLYWQAYAKPGTNPVTGVATTADRRQVVRDLQLPIRDASGHFDRRDATTPEATDNDLKLHCLPPRGHGGG